MCTFSRETALRMPTRLSKLLVAPRQFVGMHRGAIDDEPSRLIHAFDLLSEMWGSNPVRRAIEEVTFA